MHTSDSPPEEQIRPFGRAVGMGTAPYWVFPYWLIVVINVMGSSGKFREPSSLSQSPLLNNMLVTHPPELHRRHALGTGPRSRDLHHRGKGSKWHPPIPPACTRTPPRVAARPQDPPPSNLPGLCLWSPVKHVQGWSALLLLRHLRLDPPLEMSWDGLPAKVFVQRCVSRKPRAESLFVFRAHCD